MAIAEDASTPGANTGTVASGTLTVTTPGSGTFSPPVQSLLVAIVSIGHGPAANPSITVSDTGSHTWHTGPTVNGTDTTAQIYWAYLPTGATGITVSAADSASIGQGIQLDVRVLTGAAQTQTGAASNTNTGSSTQTWTGSLTTTTVGSWVYIAASANEESASITPNGNTTTLNNYQASGGPSSQLSGRQSSSTGTTSPGATTFGWTTTSGAVAFAWAALEILPAATGPSDIPQINPGPTWFDLFKPQWPKPRTPTPPAYTSAVKATGSFTLAPLTLAATGASSSPDQPQFNPGTTWLALYKPWLPRRTFSPALPPVHNTGNFRLGPLGFSGTVNQSSPDMPQILPGPTWLDYFKPGLPKPRPPAPLPIPVPPVFAIGRAALGAPLAFSGSVVNQGVLFLFTGHYPVSYPDYIDSNSLETLTCTPEQYYNMNVANIRAGLLVPPRDGRWLGYPGLGDEIIFYDPGREASEMLHAARALNSDLQARLARGEKID